MSSEIGQHYDAFPYPTKTTLTRSDPPEHGWWHLNALLRRRSDDALPRDARIWVAGCGTHQAVQWAYRFPEAMVLGTDVSTTSIGFARGLAEQLGLSNLELEQGDLCARREPERFDLVVSTGVLHHLPDPDAGLASLRHALAPNGAALLMVYSRVHRDFLQAYRHAIDLVAPRTLAPAERYERACDLIEAMLASERCLPPSAEVLRDLLERRQSDAAFVADVLLNPVERAYDFDELFAFLEGGGLRHVSWTTPLQWEIGDYLEDEAMAEAIRAAPPRDQWRALHVLAGLSSPLFELLAERADQPERPAQTTEELLDARLLAVRMRQGVAVERGMIQGSGEVPPWIVEGERLVGRTENEAGLRHDWALPCEAEPLLRAFDGTRSLREIIRLFEDRFEASDVLAIARELLPDRFGVLAPVLDGAAR